MQVRGKYTTARIHVCRSNEAWKNPLDGQSSSRQCGTSQAGGTGGVNGQAGLVGTGGMNAQGGSTGTTTTSCGSGVSKTYAECTHASDEATCSAVGGDWTAVLYDGASEFQRIPLRVPHW